MTHQGSKVHSRASLISILQKAFVRHEWVRGYLLLSPALIWSVVALALPLVILTVYSFWSQDMFVIVRVFTFENYESFFDRPIFLGLLFRSIKISLWATVSTVLIAYPIAYFVAFKVQTKKWIWILAFTLPFLTSYLLRIFSWKVILGYNGVINSALIILDVIEVPLDVLLYTELSVIVALTHAWIPFAVLPIYLSLAKIDRSLMEAAADLGEAPMMIFFRVILPLSMPGVLVAMLLIFVPTVGDYVTPTLIGGPGGSMISGVISSQFLKSNNAPMGSAAAVMSMLAITLIIILAFIVYRAIRRYAT